VELHRRVLANTIKQRTGAKFTITWLTPDPPVSPVYVRLGGGADVPSIDLMPLGGGREEGDMDRAWTVTGSSKYFFNLADDFLGDFGEDYRARKDAEEADFKELDPMDAKYWRMREYEETQALKVEERKERM